MSRVEGTCLEACSTRECHVGGGGHMFVAIGDDIFKRCVIN